jgi:hypothetical protein
MAPAAPKAPPGCIWILASLFSALAFWRPPSSDTALFLLFLFAAWPMPCLISVAPVICFFCVWTCWVLFINYLLHLSGLFVAGQPGLDNKYISNHEEFDLAIETYPTLSPKRHFLQIAEYPDVNLHKIVHSTRSVAKISRGGDHKK